MDIVLGALVGLEGLSLAMEHITDAIHEMSVGRVIIEVMLFSEGNLLGERFITRGNPPYLLMADRIFP